MNIEECKSLLGWVSLNKLYIDAHNECDYHKIHIAIETLLTAYEKEKGENVKLRLQDIPLIEGELKAYKDRVNELKQQLEKEKEKNKKIDEFCRKELAFERRLKRENREPDEFNQGRFYVSENIRKIIKEE